MAEFTELPITAGPLVPRVIYNELLNAINNRRAVVLPDATAAFTIYNNSGDADSAAVEIDTGIGDIILIVVGGVNAGELRFDLAGASYDTITELVAAINAPGKGWVAVETSGAQSAAAGNNSNTLLLSGPADCLGAAHITWFTNYSPNGVHVGSLIGNIVAYRAAIDTLVNYFYTSGTSSAVYTANTLHNAAFGDNDWDPAGAPNLTPPCLPHKDLWNNMKSCLDLLVWIKLNADTWTRPANTQYKKAIVANADSWANTRLDAFVGQVLNNWVIPGDDETLGRVGQGRINDIPDPDEFNCDVRSAIQLDTTFATDGDWGAIPTPPAITDGYVRIDWQGGPPWIGGKDDDYFSNTDITAKVQTIESSDSPFTIDPSASGTFAEYLRLQAAILAAIDVDTTSNDLICTFDDTITDDIGVVWASPNVDNSWTQRIHITNAGSAIFLKLSWA